MFAVYVKNAHVHDMKGDMKLPRPQILDKYVLQDDLAWALNQVPFCLNKSPTVSSVRNKVVKSHKSCVRVMIELISWEFFWDRSH